MTKLKKDRHTQSKKAERQSITHHKHNTSIKNRLKSLIKKLNTAINGGNTEEAKKLLSNVTTALQRSVKKKLFNKNYVSRKISQLARKVNGMKTS